MRRVACTEENPLKHAKFRQPSRLAMWQPWEALCWGPTSCLRIHYPRRQLLSQRPSQTHPGPADVWGHVTLWWRCPEHCRMLSNIPGPHPLNCHSAVTAKNGPRSYQCPQGPESPQLRTTTLVFDSGTFQNV